jgi:hypothetical protein
MKMAFVLAGLSLVTIVASFTPAMAQGYRSDNPNMRNFYMARQQIQITDDAPAVNDMRTAPGDPAATAAAVGGGGPRPLPKAGFGSYYTPSSGSMSGGLPQVVNGVPKAPPPVAAPPRRSGPTGQKGTAQKIKQQQQRPAGPTTVKAYKPYQTYSEPSSVGASGGGGLNSNSNVKGSVLHWNRKRSTQF